MEGAAGGSGGKRRGSGAKEAAWYDGNTFTCTLCPYTSHSLPPMKRHMKAKHAAGAEFRRSEAALECQCCGVAVHHERAEVEAHLAGHLLSLEDYHRLYSRVLAKPAAVLAVAFSGAAPAVEEVDRVVGRVVQQAVQDTNDNVVAKSEVNVEDNEKQVSNDMADYVKVKCSLCGAHLTMAGLRVHTKARHGLTITAYKKKFGAEADVVEEVWHRCAICTKLVLLDRDRVAAHLRTPGHGISHKEYNRRFMVEGFVPTYY